MMRLGAALLVAAFAFTGCAGHPIAARNCEWPEHVASRLDTRNPSDRRHLSDDALTAEDLAIRHADLMRGRESGQRNVAAYREIRETCKAKLFARVSELHDVPRADVERAIAHRRVWLDALVFLSFGLIYLIVSKMVAGMLFRGAMLDSRWLAAVGTMATAAALGFVGLLSGTVWSGIIETIRIGNGHLSYRVDRVPWGRYPGLLFVAGVIIFTVVAAIQHRKLARSASAIGLPHSVVHE